MPTPPLVSIIIVCWNSTQYLARCLDSLVLQTFQNFEIVIIDNGSVDGSPNNILQNFSQLDLQIKYLTSNQGFAVANNLGVKLARGKWISLLNADAFPEPNWLAELITASETNPVFASFSSRQLQAGHTEILDGAGDAYHVSGMAWRLGLGYPADRYGIQAAEIFSPCAAAAMYLREAFLDVGGFDEDFFSYFEDVDLGFRLQLRGYRCMYVPQAVVHHVGSATFGQRSDFAFYHSHRNMVWTYIKNMPSGMLWLYLLEHLIANLIYVLYYTLRGRGKVLIRAKYDALRGLPAAIKKRDTIQKRNKVASSDLVKRMERGWLQPYLLGYQLRKCLKENN